MDRWNEIAFSLNECKKKGILEDEYHHEIENLLRILGWSRHNGSLQHKKLIPIGSKKEIEADIVLQKEEQKVAIEVKHPNNKLTKRQMQQLASYMRQIKTSIGLYFGEKISLFYDVPGEEQLVNCMEVPLEQNNRNGVILCDLLTYNGFSYPALLQFCEEKHKRYSDRKSLSSKISAWQKDSNEAGIKQILSEYFIAQGISSDIVTEELGKLKLFGGRKGIDKRIPLPGDTSTPKTSTKFRRYRLNNGSLEYKRDIVQIVLRKYVDDHPNIEFSALVELFKDVKCGRKLLLSIDELRRKSALSKDILGRYNCSESDILTSGDGVDFVVCNQWAESNFPTFVTAVQEKLGWTITPE